MIASAANAIPEGHLRRLLRLGLPHPKALAQAKSYESPARRLLILVKGPNPTFSYYFENRLKQENSLPSVVRDIDSDTLDDISPDGLFVVVCRYIRSRQLAWLERNRARLAGVALFVDDDIAALVAGRDGSLAYRTYLAYFGCLPLRRLNRLLTSVWMSTPPLLSRLADGSNDVRLVAPSPVMADHLPIKQNRSAGPLRLAFHATDVHGREHAFLIPIVKQVLAQSHNASFEVLARGDNRQLWENAGIQGSQLVLLPLTDWPRYYTDTRNHGVDILLIPLLDGLANLVRADTKRIDCCRLGAAAVFSLGEVYGRQRKAGEIHLPPEPDIWVESILALASDADLREKAAAATRSSVEGMSRMVDVFPYDVSSTRSAAVSAPGC